MNAKFFVLALALALVAGPVAVSTPAAAFHKHCFTEPCDDTPQEVLCTTKWVKAVLTAVGACDQW